MYKEFITFMELDDFLERLRGEYGAVRVEVMPDDLCEMIVAEESTVTCANGMLPIKNTGLKDFMSKNTRIVVFEDGRLYFP